MTWEYFLDGLTIALLIVLIQRMNVWAKAIDATYALLIMWIKEERSRSDGQK